MKKQELVEIIRTVVREEINNSLPQFLMEVLAERITAGSQENLLESRPAQQQQQPVAPRRKPAVALEEGFRRPAAPVPKLVTSNPALNAVLAETVGGVPSQEEADTYTAADTLNSLPPEVLQENTAVAAVHGALNRDYSKLLKAVESKVRR